jgi:hypothetical protein
MPGDAHTTVELALSELRRSVDVGLAKIEGQLALLLQRAEQADRRADAQAAQIADLDDRLGKVERDQVTRADLDERARRTLMILGLILTSASIVAGAGVSLLITLLTKGS